MSFKARPSETFVDFQLVELLISALEVAVVEEPVNDILDVLQRMFNERVDVVFSDILLLLK
jgi:hypothetical protein